MHIYGDHVTTTKQTNVAANYINSLKKQVNRLEDCSGSPSLEEPLAEWELSCLLFETFFPAKISLYGMQLVHFKSYYFGGQGKLSLLFLLSNSNRSSWGTEWFLLHASSQPQTQFPCSDIMPKALLHPFRGSYITVHHKCIKLDFMHLLMLQSLLQICRQEKFIHLCIHFPWEF